MPDAIVEQNEIFSFHPAIKTPRGFVLDQQAGSDGHLLLSPVSQDQPSLSALIAGLIGTDTGEDLIPTLIPAMDLTDPALPYRLAGDFNFLPPEAVAAEITKRPRADLLEIAARCAGHGRVQAQVPRPFGASSN